MKSAAKTMYLIGRVFSFIEMAFALIGAVFAVLIIANKSTIYDKLIADGYSRIESLQELQGIGVTLLVSTLIAFIIALVVFLLAKHAQKSISKDSTSSTPHIIMIVIGLFGDIFYLLGGIFGIVSMNDDSNKNINSSENKQ